MVHTEMTEISRLVRQCEEWKSSGDAAYRQYQYEQAISYYSQIISTVSAESIQNTHPSSATERDKETHQALHDVLYIAHSNRCASLLQAKRVEDALRDAERCVALQPHWAKGHQRRATCLQRLGRLSEAVKALEQVVVLDPRNEDTFKTLQSLRVKLNNTRTTPPSESEKETHYGTPNYRSYQAQGAARAATRERERATDFVSSALASLSLFLQRVFSAVRDFDYLSLFRSVLIKTQTWWMSLSENTRQFALYALGGLALSLYLFPSLFLPFSSSYSHSYPSQYTHNDNYDNAFDKDYEVYRHRQYSPRTHSPYHSHYEYSPHNSHSLSWTAWIVILVLAYKLPPLFPQQLGDHARPFFGMNLTSFVWLLQLFTQGGGGGFGFFPMRGGGLFGRRRRYY